MADYSGIYVLGVALLAPGLGALWQTGPLRGAFNNEWADRVDLAEANLDERAVETLRDLQSAIDESLGDVAAGTPDRPDAPFLPAQAIADPAPLTRLTSKFEHIIHARRKLKARFQLLLQIYGISFLVPIPYLVGIVLAFVYFCHVHRTHWFVDVGLSLVGLALLAALVIVGLHLYLLRRLTTAEIIARPPASKEHVEDSSHG